MRLIVCALLAGLTLGAAAPDVQAVYLLPMASGLDQYLANRLTSGGVYRVVTDPKLADAVFTDQLGVGFEHKLSELFAPPEPAEGDKDKDEKAAPRMSAFGRGRGNIFLVDLKSRAVIWSAFQRQSKFTPRDLDRAASGIVEKLKKNK